MSYTGKFPKFSGVNVLAAGLVKFFNAANNHFIAFKAGTVSADKTFTLPDGDGAPNQALKTDGSGNLGWMSVGSGGVNYISNYDFEATANAAAPAGWVRYADAAGAVPVDGTGGSPDAAFTFLASTSSPIRGTVSALLTKDADNRQGYGISYDFTISAVDCNKMLSVSFDHVITADPAYATGGLSVFIYDVTNSVLITPSISALPVGTATYGASWVSTSSTSYRLIVHVTTTSTSAYTMKLDSVIVGPGQLVQGAAFGPVTDFAPTFTNATGLTYATTAKGNWQRIGNSMHLNFTAYFSGTGSDAAPLRMTLPLAGVTTVPGVYAGGEKVTISSSVRSPMSVYVNCPTAAAYIEFSEDGAPATSKNGSTFGDSGSGRGASMTYSVSIPITEWSSSVYLASGADNNVTPLNWTAFTPTGSWISNTTYTGYYRRVGDSAEVLVTVATTGAPTATGLTINLPSGLNVDTTKLTSPGVINQPHLGTCSILDVSTAWYVGGHVGMVNGSTTAVSVFGPTASNSSQTAQIGATSPFTFANGDKVQLRFTVPIVGWTAQDYLGKMLTGFATAKVGQSGIVNNDSSNTAGTAILGATDGSAASAGYVGQVLTFTSRQVTITNATTWYANSTELVTLTPGTWLILATFEPAVATANLYAGMVSSSSTPGSGAILADSCQVVSSATNATRAAMPSAVYSVASNTPIYAQAYSFVNTSTTGTVKGYALRIR